MRADTIMMTLSVAVIAAITYFALEFTMPEAAPDLAPVVPDNPPVVVQDAVSATSHKTEQ